MLMLRLLPRMRSNLGLLWMQIVIPLIVIAVVAIHTPLWGLRHFRFAHVSLLVCLAVVCVVDHAASKTACGSLRRDTWSVIGGQHRLIGLARYPDRQAVRGAMRLIDQADQDHQSSLFHQWIMSLPGITLTNSSGPMIESGIGQVRIACPGMPFIWLKSGNTLWTRMNDFASVPHIMTAAAWCLRSAARNLHFL